MEIEVRFLTERELFAAAALERACFSAPWSEKMMQDAMASGTLFFGAFAGDVFLGHMSILPVLDEGQICNLAVCPAFRRMGVGTALLGAAKRILVERGIASLVLDVRFSNEAARALYEKNGFVRIGQRRGFYASPREDGLLYLCEL